MQTLKLRPRFFIVTKKGDILPCLSGGGQIFVAQQFTLLKPLLYGTEWGFFIGDYRACPLVPKVFPQKTRNFPSPTVLGSGVLARNPEITTRFMGTPPAFRTLCEFCL
jgi:hypothetical protein